jgi:hypothetical protein
MKFDYACDIGGKALDLETVVKQLLVEFEEDEDNSP